MAGTIAAKAAIPNPALQPLGVMVGEWTTTGSHPLLPGQTLQGHAKFEWLEGGAFIIMHSQVDHPDVPAGIAVIGSDDAAQQYFMIYFDERKVSRKYDFAITDTGWKWWRDNPDFSQRFTVTVSDDGKTMTGKGELSKDGTTWEGDLNLTYTKVDDSSTP